MLEFGIVSLALRGQRSREEARTTLRIQNIVKGRDESFGAIYM